MNLAGGLWCVGGAHWTSVYQMPAKKKHGEVLLEQCSFWSTFGTEFLGTLELVRFYTKSKKSVPIGTLFQKCSKRNTFFNHAKIGCFLFLFLYFFMTLCRNWYHNMIQQDQN